MKLAQQLQAEEEANMVKEATGEDAPKEEASQGQPITSYVKGDIVKQLEEMGFSKHASEKALFMTMSSGQSIENAMNWLGEHADDADLNEQLFIVG